MRKFFYLLLFISTIASAQQQEKFNGLRIPAGEVAVVTWFSNPMSVQLYFGIKQNHIRVFQTAVKK